MEVRKLLNEIKENSTRSCRSKKDEIRVMKSMLNDKTFTVTTYSNGEPKSEFCPADEARKLIGDIISTGANIPKKVARMIADNYEFTNSDATKFVNISKEFINTYTDSGRAIHLVNENCDVSLKKALVPQRSRKYLSRYDDNGNITYDGKDDNGNPKIKYYFRSVEIPEHMVMKAKSKVPDKLKNK